MPMSGPEKAIARYVALPLILRSALPSAGLLLAATGFLMLNIHRGGLSPSSAAAGCAALPWYGLYLYLCRFRPSFSGDILLGGEGPAGTVGLLLAALIFGAGPLPGALAAFIAIVCYNVFADAASAPMGGDRQALGIASLLLAAATTAFLWAHRGPAAVETAFLGLAGSFRAPLAVPVMAGAAAVPAFALAFLSRRTLMLHSHGRDYLTDDRSRRFASVTGTILRSMSAAGTLCLGGWLTGPGNTVSVIAGVSRLTGFAAAALHLQVLILLTTLVDFRVAVALSATIAVCAQALRARERRPAHD